MNDKKDHVAGTAAGAVAGAAAGAAIGTAIPGVGNAVGAVIGGAVGAVTGGVAGNAIAAKIDPEVEDSYWRENHKSRPYAAGNKYEDLQPAYRYGWETRGSFPATARFDDVEDKLGQKWDRAKGTSKLGWDKAKQASRDAWDRIERALPGDFDRDGK